MKNDYFLVTFIFAFTKKLLVREFDKNSSGIILKVLHCNGQPIYQKTPKNNKGEEDEREKV